MLAKIFADLRHDFEGSRFRDGVDRLDKAFSLALRSLLDEEQNLRSQLEAYQAHVKGGGERIGEWDPDEGYSLWEHDDDLSMEIEDAEESQKDLRKAYMLAIYHHWERAAQRWTGSGPHAKFKTLVLKTQEAGYSIDEGLVGLRDLVNALKHNNATWGNALKQSWPSVIRADIDGPSVDWYRAIKLTDDDVRTACAVVRRSAPDPFPST